MLRIGDGWNLLHNMAGVVDGAGGAFLDTPPLGDALLSVMGML